MRKGNESIFFDLKQELWTPFKEGLDADELDAVIESSALTPGRSNDRGRRHPRNKSAVRVVDPIGGLAGTCEKLRPLIMTLFTRHFSLGGNTARKPGKSRSEWFDGDVKWSDPDMHRFQKQNKNNEFLGLQ